jgi:iron complex outermembrane receptor protein
LGAKFRGFAGDMPVRLNLAVYNMWVKNVQRANYVAIFDALAGITVNVPRAKVTGFEIDGSIEPADWLRIGGSLNYTDARFTSNQVPVLGTDGVSVSYASFDTYPDTPDWSGVFYTDVTVPVSEGFNATLHGDIYAQSSTYFSSTGKSLNPFTKSSGYALVNFRVGLEQRNGRGLSIAALVKNAFKKEYYTGGIGFASLFGLNIEVPGEPRTFLFELGYKF